MRRKMDVRKPFRKPLAALLSLAMVLLGTLSACGGDKDSKTTAPPASVIVRPSQLPPPAFALADYQERVDAAVEDTYQAELSSMCTNPLYLSSVAGDTWNRVITDDALRGRMQRSNITIYEDTANGLFLVVGTPVHGEFSNPLTCYMLVQSGEPKVLAAWVEE